MTHPTGTLAGRSVLRVGYGAMQLASTSFEAAAPVLRRAVELGVNHIDTAQFYGGGHVNELLRQALHPYPDDLVIVSKVGAVWTGEGLIAAQQPRQLREQVEANLAALGLERLEIVNLRRLDAAPGIVAEGDQLVDLDSQLAELVALRDEGKIGAVGLSTVDSAQLDAAAATPVACVQNMYSLVERKDEDLLVRAREHGVAWVPFFPLGSGFAGRTKVTDLPDVRAVAAELGVTASQVGLAWLLHHDPNTLLIAGTSSVEHLEENVAAADVVLDARAMARLDAASADSAVTVE